MSVRLEIAALIFMMVQGACFGVGVILILATPLTVWAAVLIPALIVVSLLVSVPVSWLIAPRMRLSYARAKAAGAQEQASAAPRQV